jgi:hypothetical protein
MTQADTTRQPKNTQLKPWIIAAGAVIVALLAVVGYVITNNRASSPVAVGSSSPATGGAQTSSAPPTMLAPTWTAEAVLVKLTAAGLPLTNGAVQDENTDPNDQLGRPNGYISRASFELSGGDMTAEKYYVDRGGVIEVWLDAAAAKARSDYIQGLLKAAPLLGTEYHYLNGPVLLRITGKVKPSVATRFEGAITALGSGS